MISPLQRVGFESDKLLIIASESFRFCIAARPGTGTAAVQFFQVLPTARVYARLPFFNMMNTRDAFGELLLRPAKELTVRTDIHVLRLADPHDLW